MLWTPRVFKPTRLLQSSAWITRGCTNGLAFEDTSSGALADESLRLRTHTPPLRILLRCATCPLGFDHLDYPT